MTVKKRIIIKGNKVHNIGYRPFLMEKAQELKILNFHAKNIKEDRKQVVDVRVGGEGTKIDNFLKFVDENRPEYAEVESTSVEEYEGDILTLKEFSRVFSASQLSKIVQSGVGMLDKQDITIERIDNLTKENRDGFERTDQNFMVLTKETKNGFERTDQNFMVLTKETKNGFERTDQNFMVLTKETKNGFERTDQNFTNLRDDYGKISRDLTKAVQGIEKVARNTGKLLKKSEKDRGESRDSINKLANAILKLAEKTG